jgi:hypothetical protein
MFFEFVGGIVDSSTDDGNVRLAVRRRLTDRRCDGPPSSHPRRTMRLDRAGGEAVDI